MQSAECGCMKSAQVYLSHKRRAAALLITFNTWVSCAPACCRPRHFAAIFEFQMADREIEPFET